MLTCALSAAALARLARARSASTALAATISAARAMAERLPVSATRCLPAATTTPGGGGGAYEPVAKGEGECANGSAALCVGKAGMAAVVGRAA